MISTPSVRKQATMFDVGFCGSSYSFKQLGTKLGIYILNWKFWGYGVIFWGYEPNIF